MNDEKMEEMLTGLRDDYNTPPATPREEMWTAIQSRLGAQGGLQADDPSGEEARGVISLESARRTLAARSARRTLAARTRKPLTWAVAAAAVLALGLGIGRMTAPGAGPLASPVAEGPVEERADRSALGVAALDHLVRTESLLTLVRADARSGTVEPTVGSWARGLLSQTRLLMDAGGDEDPVMRDLLEDLELVLIQIVGVANAEPGDQARVRSELKLALDGLEERDVLPRIQAVIPAGPRFAGT